MRSAFHGTVAGRPKVDNSGFVSGRGLMRIVQIRLNRIIFVTKVRKERKEKEKEKERNDKRR